MRHVSRVFVLSLIVGSGCWPASGCGSGKSEGPPLGSGDPWPELAEIYKYLVHEKLPPPKALKDLAAFRDSLMSAWPKIESGEIIVLWGAGHAEGARPAATVLAYEKNAPTQGGSVLMQNGTVKQLTAQEFQAAPKASKR